MSSQYTPPEIWQAPEQGEGKWGGINRPEAGARFVQDLPQGKHPLQLYSMATPNGQKVTIMLEELLALGIKEVEYDAHLISIAEGTQFSSGFVALNPNSKIPALLDKSQAESVAVFESGAILLHLAERFGALLPQVSSERTRCLNWLFWLQGAAPYLGGGFGHFYAYAPYPMQYPIDRFSMEAKRQLDLLDKQLAQSRFIAGENYSIADIAIWPWYGALVLGRLYNAAAFLQVDQYTHLQRWAREIDARPAVQRGRIVNRSWGEPWEQLSERHDASDIDAVLALRPNVER